MNNKLKAIKIIWLAFMMGQAMFVVITQVIKLEEFPLKEIGNVVGFFLLFIAISAILVIESYLPKIISQEIKKENTEENKINIYRKYVILQGSIMEGINLFSIVLTWLSGKPWVLGISVMIFLWFLWKMPNDTEMKRILSQ